MDPVSHYMISWLIGRTSGLERNNYRVFLLASLAPDVDVIAVLFGVSSILKYHGTFTHSVFTSAILGVLVAILLGNLRQSLPYAIAGVYLHLFIDVISNTAIVFKGGVQCLWPFSEVKCLLIYHTPIPVELVLAAKIALTVFLYGVAIYYIRKREYPWDIWWERRPTK